jgi:hypothetical protein
LAYGKSLQKLDTNHAAKRLVDSSLDTLDAKIAASKKKLATKKSTKK